jgi:hypothetical protein
MRGRVDGRCRSRDTIYIPCVVTVFEIAQLRGVFHMSVAVVIIPLRLLIRSA